MKSKLIFKFKPRKFGRDLKKIALETLTLKSKNRWTEASLPNTEAMGDSCRNEPQICDSRFMSMLSPPVREDEADISRIQHTHTYIQQAGGQGGDTTHSAGGASVTRAGVYSCPLLSHKMYFWFFCYYLNCINHLTLNSFTGEYKDN